MDWDRKKIVQLHLTLMAVATIFDNNFVAGLAAEKYFAVNLQLVGCKIYNNHILHGINFRIYHYIQVSVSFSCKRNLNKK